MLSLKEKRILRSIRVPSENDPTKPEFPPEHPRFPSTPTIRIRVPGFTNVWLKDESVNPTGTHKDRMAWEMVVTYRQLLQNKSHSPWMKKLPALSILSTGSAAYAIQCRLHQYGLPPLRVLMDLYTDQLTVSVLRKVGCRVYLHPLAQDPLTWRDILRLTENEDGFDITSNAALDPTIRFYDWMSYEIFAARARYVLIPFGTGQLYQNILNMAKREIVQQGHDPRFVGTKKQLSQTHFLGAATTNPQTIAMKLYAPFSPFTLFSEQWIRYYRSAGFCGAESKVHFVHEPFFKEAMQIAQAQGIQAEPSGLAGLALLLQAQEHLPRKAKYLIVSTGRCAMYDKHM